MSIVKDLLLVFLSVFLLIRCIILHHKFFKHKEYFIKTLTHDFRVSILAQMNGLRCLEKYSKHNANNELINDIINSCNYSLDMVSMLQYIYRFEKGEKLLNYEIFNLHSIANSCFQTISDILKERGVKLTLNNLNDSYINADKYFIKKLITTLLTIALNYAKRNSSISLNILSKNKKVIIDIIYNGSSISREEYKRMLSINPFFSTVGYGIKMFFCKKIVEFHNGKIIFKCNKNDTNCFTIILPEKIRKESLIPCISSGSEVYN